MNDLVSIMDVARASGFDKSTVSRVLNGRADKGRICHATQERIRTISRQLGYQLKPRTPYRMGAAQPIPAASSASPLQERQIGMALSVNTQASTLALIPGLEPVLAAADYRLGLVTIPDDPVAARARMTELMHDSASILCCPTVYPAVLAAVAGAIPVMAMGPGAGMAMVKTVSGEQLSEDPVMPVPEASPPPMEGTALSVPASEQSNATPQGDGLALTPPTESGSGELPPPTPEEPEPVLTPPAQSLPLQEAETVLVTPPSLTTSNQEPPTVGPTPAPDAPCPCGSGKKYKKCHGKWRT